MTDSSRTYQDLLAENASLNRKIETLERSAEDLRASEAKYRLITEKAVDVISILDMNLRFSFVSPSVMRVRGYTVEEVLGQTLDQILPPSSLNLAFDTLAAEMQMEASGTADPDRMLILDLEEYKKDGSTLWLENSMSFIRDDSGRPVGILVVSRDITEHRQADEALRNRNEELAALNQLARSVTSGLSLEDICNAAVHQVARAINPDAAILFVREGDDLILMNAGPDHFNPFDENMSVHTIDDCLCGLALRTNQPVYVIDISKDERRTRTECRNAGFCSMAAVPLRIGDDAIGLLMVASMAERDFRNASRYLETAADQIAVSIQNSRLLNQTRAYATQIQEALAEREISQQVLRKREEELMHANLMLRNVLHTIPVRVFWKDRNCRYLGCNALFARDAGFQNPEEVIGKNDFDMAWRDRAERYQSDDRLVMDSGQPRIGFENVHVTPQGIPVVLLTSTMPLCNENGDIIGILGTYQNIIRRKRTEEALKKSEALLRSVFQAVPLAMVVTDADRIVKEANDYNTIVFGYQPDEMIGRDTRCLYFSEEEYRQSGEMLRKQTPAMAEVRMRRKDGAEVWMLLNRASLNPDEPDAGLVVAGLDITARKALEEQLRQSQKMEAIGQLAGGVAHDFNNMLQAILGYTEMVLFTLGPEDRNRGKLMEVFKTGQRAAELTRQLLAFSRQQVLRLVPLDLNQTIENLMKMLHRLIGENIELVMTPGQDLWTVNADRGQIEQVLMNLCVNARDAMPDGGRLSIETENVRLSAEYCARHEWAKPGRHIRLSVIDSGIGMDEETRGKIFEPFFTTKEKGRGTGLGLATVYGIVHQHNGIIDVDSEPDRGAHFSIYLPAIDQMEMELPVKPADPAPGGKETILLAEDNEQIRLLAVEILENAGYRVHACSNGEEALRLYGECGEAVDLLLLDVVMPGKGGRAVYDEISAHKPDIRCLFMSGYSVNAVHTNFILDQGLILIQKPFKHDELLRAVRQVMAPPIISLDR